MSVSDQIRAHRSIRAYKPDPVPEELVAGLLETGIRASSSGNMQAYSIVVTRDRALREKLYEAHFQQAMVLEAPILMTFCADFHRMRTWLEINDAADNFDNYMSFMVAAIDAVLVSQNVALAAEAEGLGICYMGTTLASCRQIGELLRVPRTVVPVTSFVMGYPAENPDLRDRLPLDGLVHQETYQAYTTDRVAEIYHHREVAGWLRYMSFPDLKKRILESGVTNLAQVYTTVKYTRASHKRMSEELLGYLGDQDFMN
jgi:nitroreductase